MNEKKKISAYAAYSKDDNIRLQSSSGAVFPLLAKYILSMNGVVYGVAMSEDCRSAEFVKVKDSEGLSKLLSSKYLQAKVGKTYNTIKEDLENGTLVLFTGTGCQVNGLKCFLGKEYDNLYCVDVICHGVPSPALWRKYVEYVETKNCSKLVSVNFRCKDNSWSTSGTKEIDESHREIYTSKSNDPYMQMFLKNYCLRPSCYECTAKLFKQSDMTIADFWGIKEVAPEMDDNRGVSFVLVRSEKGIKLFNSIQTIIISKKVTYEDGIKHNPAEYRSVTRPEQRETFFIDMNLLSFSMLKKKYFPVSLKKRVKQILMKSPLKNKLGRGITSSSNYGVLFILEKR